MQRKQAIKILKAISYIGIYGGLLMPAIFIPIVIFPFVFSKLIFFQVIIGLTFPAYLALAWAEPQFRPRKSFLYFAFIAYFVALFLSMVFAVDPVRSWWGNQERMNGLFTLLHFFAWLTMTTSLIKTWKQWKNVLNYMVGLGVFMGIVALLQKPFPNILRFPAGPRVGGLLDNPIYQGAYQLFILFFIASLWFQTKRNDLRAWYVIAAIVSFSAMLAAGSRGPFMGLIFGAVISAIAVGVMYKNIKVRAVVFGGIGLALIVYIGIATVGVKTETYKAFKKQAPTAARIFDFNTGTAGRFIAWNIAWESFLERPLTGYGLDNFHIAFNKHYNPNSLRSGYYETWFDRAHNTIMDVLSMTGFLGILTFSGIWLGIYYTIIQARRKKYLDIPTTAILLGLPAGYFLQNVFVFDHPAAFSMSYLLYALVICVGFKVFTGEAGEVDTKKQKTVPWVIFGIAQAVFVLIVYLTSILPFYSSMNIIKGNTAFARGDANGMLEYATKAAEIQTPYINDQMFLHSRNLINLVSSKNLEKWPKWREFFDLTVNLHDRYFETHSKDAHSRYVYASALAAIASASRDAEMGALAEEQFKQAIELSPKRQQLFFSYGELLKVYGRVDEALDLYKQAAAFDEEVGESWWYVATTYQFSKGQPDVAAEYYIKAHQAKYPFYFKTANDALLVAEAYVLKEDAYGLKKLIAQLPSLPASQPATYIQIARSAEKLELLQERDLILHAVANMDPSVNIALQPLFNGEVETIDEALKIAEAQVAAEKAEAEKLKAEEEANKPTEDEAESDYNGPRR
jgi:O-antigen ligase/tetratricopeptide (TPR) repeat protein